MVEGKKSINFLRGILYLSPALILMAIFTFYPLFNTFIISFKEEYNYMTGKHAEWGFANYAKLFATSITSSHVFGTSHPYFANISAL